MKTENNNLNYMWTIIGIMVIFLFSPVLTYAYKLPKVHGIVYVTDFGAIPDDGLDDSDGIQAAIEYAKSLSLPSFPSLPGTKIKMVFVVYLPKGTYNVSKTLFIDPRTTKQPSYRITLMGEDAETTIIRLDDNCPGFTNAASPKPLWRTLNTNSTNTAQNYSIEDITFNTGYGNKGAIAVDHMNNNMGTVMNVKIVCPDLANRGFIGFKFDRERGGICYIQNLYISGFETGIKTGSPSIDLVFEDINISDCALGVYNNEKGIQIRNIKTHRVPSPVYQTAATASLVLINAEFFDGISTNSAVVMDKGELYMRNVVSHGFKGVFDPLAVDSVGEYVHGTKFSLWNTQDSGSLKLPVKSPPNPPREELSESVIVDCDAQGDDTDVIQNAIDSGAKTIYLSGKNNYIINKPIIVRGNVERLHGTWGKLCYNNIDTDQPALILETGTSPHLIIECFGYLAGVQNNSSAIVYLRSSWLYHIRRNYETVAANPGDLFLDEMNPRSTKGLFPPANSTSMIFRNQDVFMRAFDNEGYHNPVIADNSNVWVFGFKVGEEITNPAFDVRNGSKVELLGGLINGLDVTNRKILIINNSELSIVGAFAKKGTTSTTQGIFASETQNGVTKTLGTMSLTPRAGGGFHCPIFVSKLMEPTSSKTVKELPINSIKMYADENQLVIWGIEINDMIRVYDITGKLVYHKIASEDIMKISLKKGVFIVKIDGFVQKVMIR